jgi:hypothetical protein
MKILIIATEGFTPGCAECATAIAALASAAAMDPTLSRLTLKPGNTHCHQVICAKPTQPTLFAIKARTPNGFDSEA